MIPSGVLCESLFPFHSHFALQCCSSGTFSSTVSKTKGMTIGTTILYAVKMQICAINVGNFPFVKGAKRILWSYRELWICCGIGSEINVYTVDIHGFPIDMFLLTQFREGYFCFWHSQIILFFLRFCLVKLSLCSMKFLTFFYKFNKLNCIFNNLL